jgi:hypothetical protein
MARMLPVTESSSDAGKLRQCRQSGTIALQ